MLITKNKRNSIHSGFTLIELMIAIMIFAVIAMVSYQIISSLIRTKEIITAVHSKWGGITNTINRLNKSMAQAIPLNVRNGDGVLLPSLQGKIKLEGKFDAQLELTESGFIGDPVYGSVPPRRIGYRFVDKKLYLITWPVLNQILGMVPRVDILLDNVQSFTVKFLYPDKQWYEIWPVSTVNVNTAQFPAGIKIDIKLITAEEIMRQWAL